MSAEGAELAWRDAALVAALVAVDPAGLGGVVVRATPGQRRDHVCGWIRRLSPPGAPNVRLPLHVTDDRLLGGLSLAATLRAGHLVLERGVLARAHGGYVVVAMAERLDARVTTHLCAALDRGELSLERDGVTAALPCRVGIVALDEGEGEERTPVALRDRLAFELDFTHMPLLQAADAGPDPHKVRWARARLHDVTIGDDVIDALSQAAAALGVSSLRGPVLAAAAARAHAALDGRTVVDSADAVLAARLVLGPRATRLPEPESRADESAPQEPDDAAAAPPPSADAPPTDADETSGAPTAPLDDLVLAAAKSAIPPGMLDALAIGRAPRGGPRSAGHAGAVRASTAGGRPAGATAGNPGSGQRLNVVETLRAAAPWQPLRRRERVAAATSSRRVEVRKDDFRVTRFEQRMETSVIFAVDASGSAALQRLAEAKGAVEQVLADCYVRRDHVALLAFRGTTSALLLPPTRSLARVRRSLSELAGGGTTPLAAGIDAALDLALDARKRGKTPVIVLMTDGRANVARDGRTGAAAASSDALAGARAVRAASVRALFLDTAPRPRAEARVLAAEMSARYLPLPYLDDVGISRHVRSIAEGAS